MATKKEDKLFSPVTVQSPWKSGNAIQNLTLGGAQSTGKVDEPDNTLNEHQLRNIETAPGNVPIDKINKTPGSTEVKLSDAARNAGIWGGTGEAMTYDRMMDEINRRHPVETDEEKRDRLKRQRRNQLFAAIGDGISALSNLYFTTKGSPSADQSKSMSKALADRYEKEQKDREAEENTAMTQMLNVMNQKRLAHASWLSRKNQAELMELKKKATESGNQAALRRVEELMRHNTELEKIARDNAEADKKRKDDMAESAKKKDESVINKNNAAAGKYSSDAITNRQVGQAKTGYYGKQGSAAMIRARKSGNGRGGGGKYNPASDPNMVKVTKKDYTTGKTYQYYESKQSAAKPKKKLRRNNMGL